MHKPCITLVVTTVSHSGGLQVTDFIIVWALPCGRDSHTSTGGLVMCPIRQEQSSVVGGVNPMCCVMQEVRLDNQIGPF